MRLLLVAGTEHRGRPGQLGSPSCAICETIFPLHTSSKLTGIFGSDGNSRFLRAAEIVGKLPPQREYPT